MSHPDAPSWQPAADTDLSGRGRHRARPAEAALDRYAPDVYDHGGYTDDDEWWRMDDVLPPTTGRSRRRKEQDPDQRVREQQRPEQPTAMTDSANGRAGRNLPAAIAVGLTLGAAVLVPLLLYRPAFLGVLIVAIGIATWEMSRAVRQMGAHPPLVPMLVGGAVMAALAWYSGPSALALGLLLTILATLIWRIGEGPAGYHRDVAAATLIIVYVPFFAGFAGLLAAPDNGARRVIVTLAAVVLSDTGGYVSGVFFGQHPMAPTVSPKKSWEGFVGSLVATAIGSAILLQVLLDMAWWWGLVFGVAVAAASVLGDLAESLLKRDLGVKDMSKLLPGHGGLMDRLDSILFAAPTAYLFLSVIAPATT